MTDWDNYLGANDKPFVENLNDALLLANVFDLTVPIELPTMFNTGAWDLTTNAKQKAGVAVIQTLDATGISNGSNNTLTGTGTLKFAFYPNFNQYGGIEKVEWTADSGTITVDIYDSTGTVIKSNIPNGDIGTVGSTIRDLQNFEFRVHFNNATLTDFKVTMTNNDETRYGAEVGIDDVNGLQTELDGKSNIGHTHTYDSVTNKPETFPPSEHNHDDRYPTKTVEYGLIGIVEDVNENESYVTAMKRGGWVFIRFHAKCLTNTYVSSGHNFLHYWITQSNRVRINPPFNVDAPCYICFNDGTTTVGKIVVETENFIKLYYNENVTTYKGFMEISGSIMYPSADSL